MSNEYRDPAVAARFADIAARHRAAMDQLADEHEREIAESRRSAAEREQRTNEFLDKLTAAVERRNQAQEAEQQNQWPEREKKNRVLSFREEQEQQQAAAPTPPPPPPPRPTPKPAPEPQPSTSERSRKGRVLNFSTEDDEDEGFQGFRRRR